MLLLKSSPQRLTKTGPVYSVKASSPIGEIQIDPAASRVNRPIEGLALKGTEWAEAQVDTIRLKLFKIGARVRISARRVCLELSSAWKQIYAKAFDALRC